MKKWWMLVGTVVLAAALAAGTAGRALAQDGDPMGEETAGSLLMTAQIIDVLVYLSPDLTRYDVRQALRDGQTLGEIAQANGLTVDDVIAQTIAHSQDHLAVAVVDGRMTQVEADAKLAEASAFYAEAMTMAPLDLIDFSAERFAERYDHTLFAALAEAASMTPRELLNMLRQPVSLADVAVSLGLDPDAILDATEAEITAAVNEAVAEGRLTQLEADRLLNGLRDRLERRLNAERPWREARGLGQGGRDWGGWFARNRPGVLRGLFGGDGIF